MIFGIWGKGKTSKKKFSPSPIPPTSFKNFLGGGDGGKNHLIAKNPLEK